MTFQHTGSGVGALRDQNQALVLRQILLFQGLSRTDIAQRVGLTDAAVSRITRDLIDGGLVMEGAEVPASPGQRGRRHVPLQPAAKGAAFLAVSLTISDRRVSLVDLAGQRQAELSLPAGLPQDYPTLIETIVQTVQQLRVGSHMPWRRLLGMVATTAGAVAQDSGTVTASSLAVLRGHNLARDLATKLNLPVVAETIGNTFAFAEAQQAMQGGTGLTAGPSLVVHVAFGLGISVMLDGVPLRTGADERLGGHIPVAGGRQRCICGAEGCLMAEAAGYGILRQLEGLPADASPQRWEDLRIAALHAAVRRANSGDATAAKVMERAGQVLGRHLFALGAAVMPRWVVLGGPVPEAVAYAAGVRLGLAEAYSRAGEALPALRVSNIDYLHATELLAIEEFALRRPLALQIESA